MSLNTIEENRRQNLFQAGEQVWLFGYGSLIYMALHLLIVPRIIRADDQRIIA
jgi:hypothetical protein